MTVNMALNVTPKLSLKDIPEIVSSQSYFWNCLLRLT